jgi:hypothetical protein
MKPAHKLFVRKVLKRTEVIDENGKKHNLLKTIKEEVPEISLGSIAHPNKNIIEFEFEPIFDKTDDSPSLNWKRFFEQ